MSYTIIFVVGEVIQTVVNNMAVNRCRYCGCEGFLNLS